MLSFFHLLVLVLLHFFWINSLKAGSCEPQAIAINASSALLCCLDSASQRHSDPEKTICFQDEDILALWHKLYMHCDQDQINFLQQAEELQNRGKALSAAGQPSAARKAFRAAHQQLFSCYEIWRGALLAKERSSERKEPLLWRTSYKGIKPSNQANFQGNPYVTEQMRKLTEPFLLPPNHPLNYRLQALFGASRVTLNEGTLSAAGFVSHYRGKRSFVQVVTHPQLPEYVLKLQLDNEVRKKRGEPEWVWFSRRCQSARQIQEVIASKHIKNFTVPQKNLYPLPLHQAVPEQIGYSRKHFILVADHMALVRKDLNIAAWQTKITKKHLDELYTIISRVGGSSYRADNIWFTCFNKFAFIDTEYPYHPPNFGSIAPYLSRSMRSYWQRLVRRGGPQ